MNFNELVTTVSSLRNKKTITAVVNADRTGSLIENLEIGKVEVVEVSRDEGKILILSELKDAAGSSYLRHTGILIREKEVESINQVDDKIIVLLPKDVYSITFVDRV